ncbi:hypothetical protein RHMOL_Rhmol09G0116200 [Rhododendron molle]|uniref:Uncharacterized protein n=1 Tax=Rhododendron molle TaxID=49168 RepID=A0ACC0MDG4_RHOML|nr:hypothetical protein RHMOL_Rhmol09G0116200 [Rhododendron molle]
MNFDARLDVNIQGGRNCILKTCVEIQEAELAERINALDDLEIDVDLEDDDDFEEGASLSLDFQLCGFAALVFSGVSVLVF